MPEKKSTPRTGVASPQDPAVRAADAGGPTGKATPGEGADTTTAAAAEPAPRPPDKKSAAVRMLTRSMAGTKPTAARGETQRVADAAKPSQKPQAGGGRRGPRRGASKGR